jgi:hypothetical protein
MIRTGRFSIALLMAAVFFVAADFAIVRALWETSEPVVIAVITLPMVNLLLMVLPRARPWNDSCLFWLGFEVAGWWTAILFALNTYYFMDIFLSPIRWIDEHDHLASDSAAEVALLVSCSVVGYTIPQVMAAMVGGWVVLRSRAVIVRRSQDDSRRVDR